MTYVMPSAPEEQNMAHAQDKCAIALVVPHLGGGTMRHVYEMARAWSQQGYPLWVLVSTGRILQLTFYQAGEAVRQLVFPYDRDFLIRVFRESGVGLLHYHNFYTLHEPLLSLPDALDVPYAVTLHDYYTICPWIYLVGPDERYCGEPETDACDACLRMKREQMHGARQADSIVSWRGGWYRWLLGAGSVFVPHQDVADRLARYFPAVRFRIFENPEVVLAPAIQPMLPADDGGHIRRVACIGALTRAKGGEVLLACARAAAQHDMPVEFVLFGTLSQDVMRGAQRPLPKNLRILGRYHETDVYLQIVAEKIDFFWFPPLWPETYSYTLSIPIRLGLPVLGSNLGAVGARIEAHGWGETYPWDADTQEILARILAFDCTRYAGRGDAITNDHFPPAQELYGPLLSDRRAGVLMQWEVWQRMANTLRKSHLPYDLYLDELRELYIDESGSRSVLRLLLHAEQRSLAKWLLDKIIRLGRQMLAYVLSLVV